MNLNQTNAQAGPSKSSLDTDLFLPPPTDQPQLKTHLKSTQDLLTRFSLHIAYDKYVKPYAPSVGASGDVAPTPGPATNGTASGMVDKGKGKERDTPDGAVAAAPTPGGAGQDGGEDDGKGDKKKRNTYKHLIKNIPGKHSTKKDDYLMTLMSVPPKQRMTIDPFDMRTLDRSFAVSVDGLKGWNITALVGESAQAKEDRKKRKELKKLAKTQGVDGISSASTPAGLPPGGGPYTPAAASPSASSAPAARSAIPRPGSRIGQAPTPSQQGGTRPGTPLRVATPASAAPSQPSPAVSAPPARAQSTHPLPARPAPTSAPSPTIRGMKRGLDDAEPAHPQGNGQSGLPGGAVVGAKAGVPGARPRPVKKARMDAHGLARDMPVQQPTPQGV